MESDFSEKLKKVLADPEAMAKIMSIAGSMGANPTAETPKNDFSAEKTEEIPKSESPDRVKNIEIPPITPFDGGFNSRGIALLDTIKPLLREEKRGRVDSLTRALMAVSVMKNLRK